MRSFFNLVGYEYKKIFKRKSTIISLLAVLALMIIISIISVTSNSYWHYQGSYTSQLEADRETVRSNAGYIDEAFVKEAIEQNALMISNDDNYLINNFGRFLKNDAYIKYVLPYEKAVKIINVVYDLDYSSLSTDGFEIFSLSELKPIDTLTAKDAKEFYSKINQAALTSISNNYSISEHEMEKNKQMLSQVKTPYYNDYNEGYVFYAKYLQDIALVLLVVIAVCISPIFAGEYQLKTDQILLTSKYGKNILIYAKIFTGVSFIMATATVSFFGSLLSILCIHGFSGFDTNIQTLNIFSAYPLTMLQAVLTSIAVAIIVILYFTILVMLLSARFKTSFLAVTVSFLIIFLPGFIFMSPSNRIMFQLFELFPGRSTQFFSIFSDYLYVFFNIIFTPATFFIIFSISFSVVATPFIYRSFKNHQIG